MGHQEDSEEDSEEDNNVFQLEGLKRSVVRNAKTGRRNQRLTCLQCARTFLKLCNAADHVRAHSNTRPYSCTSCLKTFTQRGNC